MTRGPETSQTAQTSRSTPEVTATEEVTFLIRALECETPTAGASRHSLRGVDEVSIERGPKRSFERLREKGKTILRLALPDRKLSSRHARIVRTGSRWVLEDLGSTNGSHVDGVAVDRAELHDGALIELGRTLFLLREIAVKRRLAPDVELTPNDAIGLSTLSPTLEEAFARLARVAPSQLPVLLLGETGTGKEVAARAVHELSKRPGPFVAVNSGAIPETLIEAQLFGYMKGAFTGAHKNELGFVRTANYGTLFLDEIGDLPAPSQVVLLRVLQSGEVTPVGSAQPVHVDVRIVAATHRAIDELMESGAFRKDLYARLAGYVNQIPPLRERPEDLGLLIGTMLARHQDRSVRIRPNAARALFAHDWPLNVRELEQCLAGALVLTEDDDIGLEHLPASIRDAASRRERPSERRGSKPAPALSPEDAAIRDELVAALAASAGNVSEAARRMSKARQQVQRWIRRFAIDRESFERGDE